MRRDCARRSHLPEDRRVVGRERSDGRVGATVRGRLVFAAFVSHNNNDENITFVILTLSRGRAVVCGATSERRYCRNKTPAGPSPTVRPAAAMCRHTQKVENRSAAEENPEPSLFRGSE